MSKNKRSRDMDRAVYKNDLSRTMLCMNAAALSKRVERLKSGLDLEDLVRFVMKCFASRTKEE